MKMISRSIGLILFAILFLIITGDKAYAATRPNVVVIQTDDQTRSLMKAKYKNRRGRMVPVMPRVRQLIKQGTEFNNYYASSPICGPARAAFLSGQYPQNNRVIKNGGKYGGMQGFSDSHIYYDNLAVTLQANNYHTAHFGKLTNFYGDQGKRGVPPGWDTWVTDYTDDSTRLYYGYTQLRQNNRLGLNGIFSNTGSPYYNNRAGIDPRHCRPDNWIVGVCNYHTDSMSVQAAEEIKATNDPFYIQVDYHAPHGDGNSPVGAEPAARDWGSAKKAKLPGARNYNEKNTTDKPFIIQKDNGPIRRNNENMILKNYQKSIESLKAVDDGVGHIRKTLAQAGKLKNTYIIFTSDNGYFHGNHRFTQAKMLPYEEGSNLPLVIQGPGVPRRRMAQGTVSTVDIVPTVLDITGVPSGAMNLDGRSMKPFWDNPYYTPRRAVLIQMLDPARLENPDKSFGNTVPYRLNPNRKAGQAPPVKYIGIKIDKFKFVRYEKGGAELYDLRRDPHELDNQIATPGYAGLKSYMNAQLMTYKGCAASLCNVTPPRPPRPRGFKKNVNLKKFTKTKRNRRAKHLRRARLERRRQVRLERRRQARQRRLARR